MNQVRKAILLVVIAVFLSSACAPKTQATVTATVPSKAATEVFENAKVEPTPNAYDQLLDTEAEWKLEVNDRLGHVIRQLPWVSNAFVIVTHGSDVGNYQEVLCALYKRFDSLVQAPDPSCIGDSRSDGTPIEISGDVKTLIWNEFGPDDQWPEFVDIYFGYPEAWSSYQDLPGLLNTDFAAAGIGLVECSSQQPTTIISQLEKVVISRSGDARVYTFYMPTFGIIKYQGNFYKLPEDICNLPTHVLDARSSWYSDAQLVSYEELGEMYGTIIPLTVENVYPGDARMLIKVGVKEYLTSINSFDGMLMFDDSTHGSVPMEWVIANLPDKFPFAAHMLIDNGKACTTDRELPRGLYASKQIAPKALEGQYLDFTISNYCSRGSMIVLGDGRWVWFPSMVLSDTASGKQVYADKALFSTSGWFHFEPFYDELTVSDKPRDLDKDARVMEWASSLGLIVQGPEEACFEIAYGHQNMEKLGISYIEVEETCAVRFSFAARYNIDAHYVVGEKILMTSQGLPDNLNVGVEEIHAGYTTADFTLDDSMACVTKENTYGVKLVIGYTFEDLCLPNGSYILVMPNNIDIAEELPAGWQPLNLKVYKVVVP